MARAALSMTLAMSVCAKNESERKRETVKGREKEIERQTKRERDCV